MSQHKISPPHRGRRLDQLAALDWYAIRTAPQKEFTAEEILSRDGFTIFLPFREEWRRKSRYTKSKKLIRYPLMVRYLFVAFEPGKQPPWHALLRFGIVQKVIGYQGNPFVIPSESIVSLMRKHDSKVFTAPIEQRYMRTHKEFGVGDLVQIQDGVFDGRSGRVLEITNRRAQVLLEFFNTQQPVSVDLDGLEAA